MSDPRSEGGAGSGGVRAGDVPWLVAAPLFGLPALLGLVVFLWTGSVTMTDVDLSPRATLAWDALVMLVFPLQHSVLVRRSVRRRLARIVEPARYGAFYGATSGLALLATLVLWQTHPTMLFELEGIARLAVRVAFLLGLAGLGWGALAIWPFDSLGVRALLRSRRGEGQPATGISRAGPYAFVRHPLYSFVLILLFATPEMSADRLLLALGWTVWTVIATILEERDLVAEVGEVYREYQRSTPMLLPFPRR